MAFRFVLRAVVQTGLLPFGLVALGLAAPALADAGGVASTASTVVPMYSRAVDAVRLSIAEFGAVADGKTLNTVKIQAAIDHLAEQGGGTVVVPKGEFLTGAIFLKRGVNLHLDAGAVLSGSIDRKDYPKRKIRIEGHFEEWLPALVNAEKCDGLRITGSGMLNGNGAPFWKEFWDALNADRKTKNVDVPRPRLMLISDSNDVQVSGLVFKDSAFWNLHVYRCNHVVAENLRFEVPGGVKCPSTDGTDVDSCQNVTIRGCTYRVDDDCIALKGSKGPDAEQDRESPPVEHVRIENCSFERGHGAVTLGSEATIVRDVVVENCTVSGAMSVLRLKLRSDTPQHYEDVHVRGLTLDNANGALLSIAPWSQYTDLKGQPPPKSTVRNITVSEVKGRFGTLGSIKGNPGQTEISDITLENIDVRLKVGTLKGGSAVKDLNLKNVSVD